eukprot:TRINITY_DN21327_c0_g1_i1.p1 TRINITY_DN21327_c0_g1~~TRINITY_DN21327_c0_g1_i1.p1  ORF type:complete len:136 (+),score=61.67 TRINITY_DN21327_c0_g1_i1:66-473(+)
MAVALQDAVPEVAEWDDPRQVIKMWGEDEALAPKFMVVKLWGIARPQAALFYAATAMFMQKQRLLTINLEPYGEDQRMPSESHVLTVVRPSRFVKNGMDWTIPEADGLLWNGQDVSAGKQEKADHPAVAFRFRAE